MAPPRRSPAPPAPSALLPALALVLAVALPLAPPAAADADSCLATMAKNCRLHCHAGGRLEVQVYSWNVTVAAQVACGGAAAHCEGFGACHGVSPKVPLDGEGVCDLVMALPTDHAVCTAFEPS